MARPARRARRQAARAGLLTLLVAACAVIQEPPGGPPDFTPPSIVRVSPDSGAVVERFSGRARIEFDEVISERSGGGLERLVRLAPRPDQLDIDWQRTAIAVRPREGWRANRVYQLTLLPGIQDLRNNQLDSGRTIVFSTGGPIPDTRITGTVLDWEQGRAGRGALIEAVLLPDSLVYTGKADSTGAYALAQLPHGRYLLFGVIDQNNDGRRDPRELFDSVSITLDSTAHQVFWAHTQDTLGPELRTVARVDSMTVRLEFSRHLHPAESTAVTVFALPDTVAVAVAAVWRMAQWDSIRAARAAERAEPGAPDTVAAPPAPREPVAPRPPVAAPETPADSTAAQRLLATRPRLQQALFVELAEPLIAGSRYVVGARAVSVVGRPAESRSVLILPAARDST